MILLINTVQKLKQHQIQKFKNILSSLSLSDVGVFLKDGPFKSDIGIVNLSETLTETITIKNLKLTLKLGLSMKSFFYNSGVFSIH